MRKKPIKMTGAVAHHRRVVEELRVDPAFAAKYLKAAAEEFDRPGGRGALLIALRQVAEAYGGVAKVAGIAGVKREALYRALSPKGNPTLSTLLAVLKAVGLRLVFEKSGSRKAA